MSNLRIALIAEGPTDAVVIDAALKATLGNPYVLTLLQPEVTYPPRFGNGWCGEFKWCRDFAERSSDFLEEDPTLPGFDLFIIHVDADVAEVRYGDCGRAVEISARELAPLPCSEPCPPPHAATDAVRERIKSWLGLVALGPRTVLCVPSKAIDAWLAAAALPKAHPLLGGLECRLDLSARLEALPKRLKITKTKRSYQELSEKLVAAWSDVRLQCSQADRFTREVAVAFRNEPADSISGSA